MFTKMSIPWLLILSSNVVVQAQTGDMYTSPNMPSFYQGEQGTFTCQLQTNDQVPFDDVEGFGLRRTSLDGSDVRFYPQCTVEVIFGQPKTASAVTDSIVSDKDCSLAYQQLADNGTATLQFNWNMQETGSYQCSVYSISNSFESDAVTKIDQLLVAPIYYQTDVPNGVYAGEKVNFHCNSDDGDPHSNWQYAIDGENIRGEPRTTYVASPADNGKLISCYDLSHPNYNGRNGSAYDEYRMEVYYMESKEVTIENTEFNNATLECDFNRNLPSGTNLSFSWSKNGVSAGHETESLEIIIGESDIYECTVQASDSELRGPFKVTFRVKWVTISTTAQSTPTTTDMAKSFSKVEFRSSTITGPKASKTVEPRSSIAIEAKSSATTGRVTEQIWVFIIAGCWLDICI